MPLAIVLLFGLALGLFALSAWITNLVYAVHHFAAGWSVEVVASFVGIVVAPIGTIHGIYLWF